MNRTIIIILLLVTVGCGQPHSEVQLGGDLLTLSHQDWDGTWGNGEGTLHLRVQDGKKGVLTAALITWGGSKPQLESYEITIRDGGRYAIANLRDKQRPQTTFIWALVKREGEHLLVWRPNAAKLSTLIKVGRLHGKLNGDQPHIATLSRDETEVVLSFKVEDNMFEWDNPMTLVRVAKE